jgi:hypothetical protein
MRLKGGTQPLPLRSSDQEGRSISRKDPPSPDGRSDRGMFIGPFHPRMEGPEMHRNEKALQKDPFFIERNPKQGGIFPTHQPKLPWTLRDLKEDRSMQNRPLLSHPSGWENEGHPPSVGMASLGSTIQGTSSSGPSPLGPERTFL